MERAYSLFGICFIYSLLVWILFCLFYLWFAYLVTANSKTLKSCWTERYSFIIKKEEFRIALALLIHIKEEASDKRD